MLKGKNIFISGGAGVIGRELVALLQKKGANLLVGDLKEKPGEFSAAIRYRQGDLNEIKREELLDFNPHYFFHLAATFERSRESYDFWPENERHNLRLSHYLIDILRHSSSLKRVVFASSYLVYNPAHYLFDEPKADPVLLHEHQSPLKPRNLCGAAKLYHEEELAYLQTFPEVPFSSVSARIFRSYGKGSQDVVARWIDSARLGEPITLYSPEGRFDYIYAGDAAEGLLRLGETDFEGVVNLGSGKARSVGEVVGILRSHFPSLKVCEEKLSMPYEASQADMSLFKSATGWLPQTSLEKGIEKMIASD